MKPSLTGLAVAILVAAVGTVVSATASVTNTITLGTGVSVTPPPGGTVLDPSVEVSVDGGATWSPAYSTSGGPYPAPLAGPTWDAPSPDPFQGWGNPQDFLYRVKFTLPAGFTDVSLTGSYGSDDQGAAVTLNNATIETNTYEGFVFDPSPKPFATTDASLFVVGENVLVLRNLNLGGATGINFQATVTYSALQPTGMDDCKKGGWESFGIFKNQGQCVAFVVTGGAHQPR